MRSLLIIALLLAPLPAAATTIKGTVHWRGKLTQTEAVRVEPGAALIIESGTIVTFTRGGLEVAGRLTAEGATLKGREWQGVTLKGTGKETRLRDTIIEGAATGLLVLGGEPQLEGLTLRGNQVGMELRQKTEAVVSRCRFQENAKVGLFLKDGATSAVTNNHFERNGKFGAYLFRSEPREFSGNTFLGNATGLMISHFGSDPAVTGNRFEKNGTAIQVDRAARPLLSGNTLLDNETGVHLSRRSDPSITGNLLRGNRTGIHIAFSSYPRIQGNDLEGNQTSLVLEHQSSAWELANGAAAREAETAHSAFGSSPRQTVSETDRKPGTLNGTVDARENWWGEERTRELAALGGNGNPSFIHDGRDTPTFADGGKDYPLDKVLFYPWSSTPLTKGKFQ